MLETPKAYFYYQCEDGEDVTMDNQQTLTEAEMAWMSGFFDGEGCVDMNVAGNHSANLNKNTKRRTIIVPRLTLVNTDYGSIMYWRGLWEKAGVGVHIGTRRRGTPKHKTCYAATINGHKRCLMAIPVLSKYSVTKREQLDIMSRWLDHRRENYQYNLDDYEYFIKFKKAMNSKGPNDSTLRRLYEACTAPKYQARTPKVVELQA